MSDKFDGSSNTIEKSIDILKKSGVDGLIEWTEHFHSFDSGSYNGNYHMSAGIYTINSRVQYLNKITNKNNDYNIIISVTNSSIVSYSQHFYNGDVIYHSGAHGYNFDEFIQFIREWSESYDIVNYLMYQRFEINEYVMCDG